MRLSGPANQCWSVQIPELIEEEICLHALADTHPMLPILDRFSSFTPLKRITAWIFHFVENCRPRRSHNVSNHGFLTVEELIRAERSWFQAMQAMSFLEEIASLKKGSEVHSKGCSLPLHPFLNKHGLLRVGGRVSQCKLPRSHHHPIILPGNHTLAKLIIHTEHLRLLNAGPTLSLHPAQSVPHHWFLKNHSIHHTSVCHLSSHFKQA